MPPLNGHSILGASSAHRWMHCPGSIRMSEGLPDSTSSYAKEGSAAHYLAEACLRKKQDPGFYAGCVIRRVGNGYSILKNGARRLDGDFEVDYDMAEAVQLYLDTIRADIAAHPDMSLVIEQKFDLSDLFPGMFGTNDACLCEPFGKCIVYDYKHGAGVPVDVKDNPQLLYYALGAYLGNDCADVELVVVQPRARHADGPVRRWELAGDELADWAKDKLIPAAKATEAPGAPLVSGDWCRFCKAAGVCRRPVEDQLAVMKTSFTDIRVPQVEELTLDQMIRFHTFWDIFSSCHDAVAAELQRRLMEGETVPGYKLVQKKTNRQWADEKAIITACLPYTKSGLFKIFEEPKVLSPAKLEKLVKQKCVSLDLNQFITKPDGGLTMVSESDRREAVDPQKALLDQFTDF